MTPTATCNSNAHTNGYAHGYSDSHADSDINAYTDFYANPMHRQMLADPEAQPKFGEATYSAASSDAAADTYWFAASYSGPAPIGVRRSSS